MRIYLNIQRLIYTLAALHRIYLIVGLVRRSILMVVPCMSTGFQEVREMQPHFEAVTCLLTTCFVYLPVRLCFASLGGATLHQLSVSCKVLTSMEFRVQPKA